MPCGPRPVTSVYPSPWTTGLNNPARSEPPASDDELPVAVDKITSEDSSDDKSFISIIGVDKREEAFKNQKNFIPLTLV
ncbi:unnamed protein product [Didymodactylos carnosus]|uniref:Uncharacterized protein n=1 Tax=Didymodactylos carnosus TaxID=1234261 RepID=A0A814EML6_9BILA|nr:unnamed protein product [Didymodactylos carnosus]CAF3742507.1 unnamed protein product [Didymodactylos carnosus]